MEPVNEASTRPTDSIAARLQRLAPWLVGLLFFALYAATAAPSIAVIFDDSLEFHIRKVPGGVTSQHVHEALKAGDKLTLEFPLGSSYLRQHHSGPILCIAGGSGLAPIKSIVETALAHGMKQPIHVYFGARGARDLYLVEHFETLADRHNNLSFTAVLSDTQVAPHRHGFVTDAVAEDLADFDGWKAYVAGPPPMVDAAMAMAFARGLRPEDMHADVFFTPEGQEG